MNSKLFLFILLMFSSVKLRAQSENDRFIEQIIESIAENAPEDFDYSELSERLNYYLKHPINLNKVTAEQLQELIFLSQPQINAFLKHRNENGRILEFYELQSIPEFSGETIKKLLPFCTLEEALPISEIKLKGLIKEANGEIIVTYAQVLQQQSGYIGQQNPEKSNYIGAQPRFLSRYRCNFGEHLTASLNMEKDAGEKFSFDNRHRGFDFYSGNIAYRAKGVLRKLIIGDYSLQFAQGLSMWTGLSFGKGADVASITKNNTGLKPYTSTNELLFLRGLATTLHYGKVDFTPFVSLRNMDGAIDVVDGSEKISSINATGFHRTVNEVENQSTVKQLVYGGNIQYTNHQLRLGGTFYSTEINKELEKGEGAYKAYSFSGTELSNLSAYYNYNWRNLFFFGEAARSLNSGYAYLNGVLASLSPKVSLILFQRDYQKNYHSFFNQAVSEGTNAVNEKGFYSGLMVSPDKKIQFNLYADFFKFPWLRFRADAPSSGIEWLSQLSYSPSKRISTVLRYKYEQKEENDSEENTINQLSTVRKENFRFELSYKLSTALQLRNRVEVVKYEKDKELENGYVIFQDLVFNPMLSRLSGNFRFAIFDTPGFNSRVYAFENDVLYNYSLPAYQNRGTRFYLNGRWRVNRSADIWIKYALTSYTDLESIGTGAEKIEGNKKSDVKLQLRIQF